MTKTETRACHDTVLRLDAVSAPRVNPHVRTASTFVLPGMSLMQVTTTAAGVHVRCPGCHAERTFPHGAPAPAFDHNDRGCPVYREIAAALEAFDALNPAREIGARHS